MVQHDSSSAARQGAPQDSSGGGLSRRQFFAVGTAAATGALGLSLADMALGEQASRESARELPGFMEIVSNRGKPASKRDVAEKSILKLDSAMNELYATTLRHSKRNLR